MNPPAEVLDLRGLSRAYHDVPDAGILVQCAGCLVPYSPLLVACGVPHCPGCLVESDDEGLIGCRRCARLSILCQLREVSVYERDAQVVPTACLRLTPSKFRRRPKPRALFHVNLAALVMPTRAPRPAVRRVA